MKAETWHGFRTSLNTADTSHFEPGANPATTPQTVYADATVQKQKHRLNNKATVNSVSKPAPRHHGKRVQTCPRSIMGVSWTNRPRSEAGGSDSLRSGLRHREVTIKIKDSAKCLEVRNSQNAQTAKYPPTPMNEVFAPIYMK